MRIAVVYSEYENLPQKVYKENPHGPEQMKVTLKTISEALENYGHEVFKVAANVDTLRTIMDIGNIDVIFAHYIPMLNKKRQGNLFAMLELLDIPIVGSGIYAHTICLYKQTTKLVLRSHGIPTPPSQLFYTPFDELDAELKERFPLFVKPESEGASLGIRNDSLVHNEEELRKTLNRIFKDVEPPIIVEEYLSGREFTVGVLGDEEIIALPVLEFIYEDTDDVKFQSVERKSVGNIKTVCPAEISKELELEMKEIAIESFKAVKAGVYLRVDLRMDRDGNISVIEVNTMPGLEKGESYYNETAKVMGIEYDELINRMAEIAHRTWQDDLPYERGKF
ncbi:MAG: ATP-grasp domain-containing protein [Tissierellia bacterium]|nr:ATP-grasp domain-containing protein [Tissierellia bacterium]